MTGLVAALGLTAVALAAPPPADDGAGEARALAFLAREVPLWSRENHCFSCHNNGDAARALMDARRRGVARAKPTGPGPGTDPLSDTLAWLARPEGWDRNGGQGPFSDKTLARVQFTAALADAVSAGLVTDRAPLLAAAATLAKDQAADGSWPIEGEPEVLGSPAAYGRPLATLTARNALYAADPLRYRSAVERADRWLDARPVVRVMDASIALLAVGSPGRISEGPGRYRARRTAALERLRAGQSDDGGWGPYVDAPPEAFDTALAMLALARQTPDAETRAMIARGRAYLLANQNPDGSWSETTRPSGAESYAQRLSTIGWAALALLATAR
ncbi:MAG: prenyltransferase/squalene oxidase repeat-containing protein [Isosphaeraceae bacterium]